MADERAFNLVRGAVAVLAGLCLAGLIAVVLMKGGHYVSCLDSEREGCPNWCWTCGPPEKPCKGHGGVQDYQRSELFNPTTTIVCRDGAIIR